MSEEEAAVFDFTTELMTGRTVSETTFVQPRRLFSEQQIVDLTAVVGTYVTIAMLLEMAKQACRMARHRRLATSKTRARKRKVRSAA
jgi:hypothetical protein